MKRDENSILAIFLVIACVGVAFFLWEIIEAGKIMDLLLEVCLFVAIGGVAFFMRDAKGKQYANPYGRKAPWTLRFIELMMKASAGAGGAASLIFALYGVCIMIDECVSPYIKWPVAALGFFVGWKLMHRYMCAHPFEL